MLYMLSCVWMAVSVWEGVEGWGLSDSGGWLPLPTLQHLFLVADTQLYERLCLSVCRSVHQHESKSGKTRIQPQLVALYLTLLIYYQLWKTTAPKRIELHNSIWADFDEFGVFFKTSPS